jgi:uncharacterized SAM-binding protein YcdF (DUF218 family)
MFIILSKAFGLLLEPLIIPYLFLAVGLFARWRRWRWMTRLAFFTAIALPLGCGFLPISSLPLQFLENRITRGDIGQRHFDGIIVLGGFTDNGIVAQSRHHYTLGGAAERFTAAMTLVRAHPDTPILFSGFSGGLPQRGWRESDNIRDLIKQLGGLNRTILYEENSRDTYESAVNSRQILAAVPGTNWILITSANHMPRAIGSFAAAGWSGMIPYPVDFQTPKTGYADLWDINQGIVLVRQALNEYAGLLFYYLSGRSATLLPD